MLQQLIEQSTGNVVYEHDDANGSLPQFGGPWGDSTNYKWSPAPKSRLLEIAKKDKIVELKGNFAQSLDFGFICANGITMNAHLEDVQKLKAGHDLALKLSQTTMDVRDFNNVTHKALPVADVDAMIVELGQNYLTLWTKKNQLIDAVNAAKTINAVNKVVW